LRFSGIAASENAKKENLAVTGQIFTPIRRTCRRWAIEVEGGLRPSFEHPPRWEKNDGGRVGDASRLSSKAEAFDDLEERGLRARRKPVHFAMEKRHGTM
jgi:hypothetical protein